MTTFILLGQTSSANLYFSKIEREKEEVRNMDGENIQKGLGGLIGIIVSGTGITAGEIESIVSIVCSIIGLLITIAFVVVIPVVKKIIAAKKDGKITADEVEDILDTVQNGLEQTKDEIDKMKK